MSLHLSNGTPQLPPALRSNTYRKIKIWREQEDANKSLDFVVCPVSPLGLEAWGHVIALPGAFRPEHEEQCLSDFNQESPDSEVLTQWVCGGAWEAEFLTSSQVTPMA